MVSVDEVAKVVKLLADLIADTREIFKALSDGRAYLKQNFPDARGQLTELLTQMRHTLAGLAEVTAVPGQFRFVFNPTAPDPALAASQLTRFNDYVIDQEKKVQELRNRLSELKGSCRQVAVLRHDLNILAGSRGVDSLFGMFGGAARQRAAELGNKLGDLYGSDEMIIGRIAETLALTESALRDVNQTLGPPGHAHPDAVPAAAAQLGVYATLFEGPTRELNALANELDGLKTALLG